MITSIRIAPYDSGGHSDSYWRETKRIISEGCKYFWSQPGRTEPISRGFNPSFSHPNGRAERQQTKTK